jgi:hydroxyacylglutathione hydrolase
LKPGIAIDRFVYAYAVFGKAVHLVDSGVKGGEEKIFKALERSGRGRADIASIVLTHSHPDHIGGAKTVKEQSGCRVYAHGAEKEWIENVRLQSETRPVPGFDSLVGGSVEVDTVLEDGDTIELENGLRLRVFHTDGHSSGSVSLFEPISGALFCGDAVPQPGSMPVYEDVDASVRSIRKLMTVENVKILFSSWDDPKEDSAIGKAFEDGLAYLQAIHEAVVEAARNFPGFDGVDSVIPETHMKLCAEVIEKLGLPPFAANPIVARSIAAHLPLITRERLF